MQLPKGDVSLNYYVSKLNVLNLTFLNTQSMNSDCYVWDKSHAKRGANEIGSCVFYYIAKLVATKPNQDFILYTDNCAGQKKSISCCVVHLYGTDNGHIIDYAQVFD